jgi:hypothetical protein
MPEFDDEVEALPMTVDGQDYCLLNIVNIQDCLDALNSTLARYSPDLDAATRARFPLGRIMKIDKFVFLPNRMSAQFLFKLPGAEGIILGTDRFRTLVLERALTGVKFVAANG